VTANAKVVSSPPALFGMLQWNRYTDRGKEISTMGTSDFLPKNKFKRFFVRFRSRQKKSYPFLTWTVLDKYEERPYFGGARIIEKRGGHGYGGGGTTIIEERGASG
jgi:hypothetical protein